MIAQVDEDQVAMIPLAVHPTGHLHLIADLRRRKGAAGVGAIGLHGVFGLSASFYANDKFLQRRYGHSCPAFTSPCATGQPILSSTTICKSIRCLPPARLSHNSATGSPSHPISIGRASVWATER